MAEAQQKHRIDFLFFDAGGGHRAAATALEAVAKEKYPHWDVRLVDVQDVLDELDIFRKLTGLRLEDIYNLLLEKGWTLGSTQLLPLMHLIIRIYHRGQVRVLRKFWSTDTPRLAVSLVPNFNRSLYQAIRAVNPQIPYVTVLTDMADYPPRFWIEPQQQIFVCGTAEAAAQAQRISPASEIHRVSGMILNPRFYNVPPVDVPAERTKLGLDPAKPTAVVLFGGMGSNKMLAIHDRLEASGLDLQLIYICGKNEKLKAKLEARRGRLPKFVEGFTREVPRYMQLGDFLIGKPGPGSISEAIHMGLPVIVEKNAWTLPQERFNADWVVDNGVGIRLGSMNQIAEGCKEILAPGRLDKMKAAARAMHNQAVFEVPAILDKILACAPPASASSPSP
jgi:hypothetical protein